MEYQLASSSTEEGEVVDAKFPYYKSYLQYYYYPHTTKFIGKNSVPHFVNYKSDLYCTKLRKDIKADYPYIAFNLLESSKTFFDNKFLHVKDLVRRKSSAPSDAIPLLSTEQAATEEFVLRDIKTDYRHIGSLDKKSTPENKYDKFYQQLLFVRGERTPLVASIQKRFTERVIIMEDKVLDALDKDNAYIFCRVIVESPQAPEDGEKKTTTKIVFEDIFYNRVCFYEYLGLYAESLVKSFNSEEVRVYESKDTLLVVYSSTVYQDGAVVRRLYSTLDAEKNTMVIFNREGPVAVDCRGQPSENIEFLGGLDLPEGDYVINGKKVYKISSEGESVEYTDIDFSDFTRSRWE